MLYKFAELLKYVIRQVGSQIKTYMVNLKGLLFFKSNYKGSVRFKKITKIELGLVFQKHNCEFSQM